MKTQNRFLISYICDNQPSTIELSSDNESLDVEEAEKYIRLANTAPSPAITDIRVVSLHRAKDHVHPGHYQQPGR